MIPIDEKLRTLQPVLGARKTQNLRQMYFLSDDYKEKKEIEDHIDLLIARHVKPGLEDEIILPPPAENACAGDINIGEVEYLNKRIRQFSLYLKDLNRHVGVFGSTGSGKTTFAKNLLRQLHQRGIPFLIFDWEKSYRGLTRDLPGLQVFTVGNDINPLFLNFLTVPPGIKYDEYIKSVITIISEDYVGGIGADTMLLNYMEAAFQETRNPYFEDLKHIFQREIIKDKGRFGRLAGRSGLWKESVGRQITFLSKGASGSIVNERKHYPIEQLFSKPIVLEFGNLKSPHDRKFFIHVILNWLSIYTQHRGIQSEHLKQILLFEEFHNIAMQGKEDNLVSNFFRESRKYGIGLVAIDQTPSQIPNSIFANMNTKTSFSLTTNKDINAMAKAIGLEPFKAKYFGMLSTGQAIASVKQRHHEPFVIRPPFIESEDNMSDEELKEAMSRFAKHSRQDSAQNKNSSVSQTPHIIESFSPLEKVILQDIIENPFAGVDDRTKRLGLHPSVIAKLHSSLEEKGVVSTGLVDQKKLFQLTEKGRAKAMALGLNVPKQESKGGLEHNYWVEHTRRFLRKHELQAVLEKEGIDIQVPAQRIAIEVETGKSNIPGNLAKLANHSSTSKFMLSTNKPVEATLREIARTYPSIKVMSVKEFQKLTIEGLTKPGREAKP